MTLAAFFAVIAITSRTGDDSIQSMAGVARRSPLVAGVLALALLTPEVTPLCNALELSFEMMDTTLHTAAINFQLGFPRATATNAPGQA